MRPPVLRKSSIVLVEGREILRDGLRALLDRETDLVVVGTAADAAAALTVVRECLPDLVITDIQLSDCPAMGLLGELAKLQPPPRILVLTSLSEEEFIRESLNRGVNGYVLKDSGRAELLLAIRTVVSGSQYLCTAVAAKVVSGFVNGREPRKSVRPETLVTVRERQVLIHIASGRSNKLIARTLGLSVKTVEKHRANLMRKLTLHNAAAVTMFALKHGFIDAAPPEHPGPSEPIDRSGI